MGLGGNGSMPYEELWNSNVIRVALWDGKNGGAFYFS